MKIKVADLSEEMRALFKCECECGK